MSGKPEWWNWELDFGHGHIFRRMLERSFNETDVRQMLDDAADYSFSRVPGRYIVHSHLDGTPAHIIVEPDVATRLLVIVTVYFDA